VAQNVNMAAGATMVAPTSSTSKEKYILVV